MINIITQADPKHWKCLFIKCMATAAELSHELNYYGFYLKPCLGKTINKPETDPSGAACDENNLPHLSKFPTLDLVEFLNFVVNCQSALMPFIQFNAGVHFSFVTQTVIE